MARSKGKKQASGHRDEAGRNSPHGKSPPSIHIDASMVTTSASAELNAAGMRTQASQGRNSNRRSLFMAGDLFKRNQPSTSSTTATTATDPSYATGSSAPGAFTPERTPVNQRLKDSDTASIRSNSSVRSNIAQRLRRVFSASNMFDKHRGGDSDGKHDRRKEVASAPGSRPDTPDTVAHAARKGSSSPMLAGAHKHSPTGSSSGTSRSSRDVGGRS
ncbi:hypothetical protein SYNPS1DRAFT_30185, partial [Syncephalis pseudoplumigaleata]